MKRDSLFILLFLATIPAHGVCAEEQSGFWTWVDTKGVKTADILTTDGPGNAMDETAMRMSSHLKDSQGMKSLVAQKRVSNYERAGAQKTYTEARQGRMNLKKEFYREYKNVKAKNPNMNWKQAGKTASARVNYSQRAKLADGHVRSSKAKLDASTARGKGLNKQIAGKTGRWGKVKGLLKAGGKLLQAMDIAAATGRVLGEAYHAASGHGSWKNVGERIVQEAGRMKATAMGASLGGTAGSVSGPGGTFLGALYLGNKASSEYQKRTSGWFGKRRDSRYTAAAKALYAPSPAELAAARARAQVARDRELRRRKQEAREQARKEAIEYNKKLREQVRKWNRENARQEAARKKTAEAWEEKQIEKMKAQPLTMKLALSKPQVAPGEKIIARLNITGGKAPYRLSGDTSGNCYGSESVEFTAPRQPGEYSVTISAVGAEGRTGTAQTIFEVVEELAVTLKPARTEVKSEESVRVDIDIKGGVPPFRLSGAVSGTLSDRTGYFDCVAQKDPGKYPIKISVADKNNLRASTQFSITVKAGVSKVFQGSLNGSIWGSGGTTGDIHISINRTTVTGRYSGKGTKYKNSFSGRIVNGTYDIEKGVISGVLSGKATMPSGTDDDGNVLYVTEPADGKFSGTLIENGFKGWWKDNFSSAKGGWKVTGGRSMSAKEYTEKYGKR